MFKIEYNILGVKYRALRDDTKKGCVADYSIPWFS